MIDHYERKNNRHPRHDNKRELLPSPTLIHPIKGIKRGRKSLKGLNNRIIKVKPRIRLILNPAPSDLIGHPEELLVFVLPLGQLILRPIPLDLVPQVVPVQPLLHSHWQPWPTQGGQVGARLVNVESEYLTDQLVVGQSLGTFARWLGLEGLEATDLVWRALNLLLESQAVTVLPSLYPDLLLAEH